MDNQFKITLALLRAYVACDFARRKQDLAAHLGKDLKDMEDTDGLTLYGWAEVDSVDCAYCSATNADLLWAARCALHYHDKEYEKTDWLRDDATAYPTDEAVRQLVLDWYTAACAAKP